MSNDNDVPACKRLDYLRELGRRVDLPRIIPVKPPEVISITSGVVTDCHGIAGVDTPYWNGAGYQAAMCRQPQTSGVERAVQTLARPSAARGLTEVVFRYVGVPNSIPTLVLPGNSNRRMFCLTVWAGTTIFGWDQSQVGNSVGWGPNVAAGQALTIYTEEQLGSLIQYPLWTFGAGCYVAIWEEYYLSSRLPVQM